MNEGNHMVDFLNGESFDLEKVTKVVFDDRLGQATIYLENATPIVMRTFRERVLLRKICYANLCGLYSKTFDHNGVSFEPQPRVNADAKPAPTLERVNLWTVVQASIYDSQKHYAVQCADRVVGALERDKPTIICVGNVLYYRQDKAIQDAKELRERAATLISSLRTVIDEAMFKLRSKPKRPRKVSVSIKPKPKKTAAKKGAKRR